MTAWLAMTVAIVARITSGSRRPVGRQQEERIVQRLGVLQDQRTLAQIVQRQAGKDEPDPGDLDRRPAEMAHVGVERLGAGDGEEDAAQDDEADSPWSRQEAERVTGLKADQDPEIVVRDGAGPSTAMIRNQTGGDRPEDGRHRAGAVPLDREQGRSGWRR